MKRAVLLSFLILILATAISLSACKAPAAASMPVIESFEASPATVAAGESAMLNWKVPGATAVSIDQGIGSVALTGTRAVAPAETTTYTLTASSAAGSVTATTQVIVSGTSGAQPPQPPAPGSLPVVNYFTASPTVVPAGGSATLSWSVTNATSVTIEPGVGTYGSSGSTVVFPPGSTIYALTATNSAGSASATATVNVLTTPEPPVAPSFRVTDVSASVSPTNIATTCPKIFTCTVTITANGPGTVTYRWENSDGGYSPTQTMTFSAAGSQTAYNAWARDATGDYWVRVRVLTPNELVSNQAGFTLTCIKMPKPPITPIIFQVTNVAVEVVPATYTGPCFYTKKFKCKVTITTNAAGTVKYKWVRSDGESAEQTMVFSSAGSQTAETSWNPPKGIASIRVETTSPNKVVSNIVLVQNNCQ